MTPARPLAAALALGLLAGCHDVRQIPPGPPPEPLPVAPAELRYEWSRGYDEALALAEEIAARCWLDAELGADALIVDRATGRMVMTAGDAEVLVVDFLEAPNLPPGGVAQMRLSGPALADAARVARMLEPITEVERTGSYTCPGEA